ncbi:hypothetical protein GCM10027168_13510 [Streptomyces capparidis]
MVRIAYDHPGALAPPADTPAAARDNADVAAIARIAGTRERRAGRRTTAARPGGRSPSRPPAAGAVAQASGPGAAASVGRPRVVTTRALPSASR